MKMDEFLRDTLENKDLKELVYYLNELANQIQMKGDIEYLEDKE